MPILWGKGRSSKNDPWKHLRQNLFGNVEPEVTLEAITVPLWYVEALDDQHNVPDYTLGTYVQAIPGKSARISYGGHALPRENDPTLTRKIIQLGHHTPLEAVQFNFHVSGISKSCGSQLSRHRIGQGHVSSSRRYQEQQPAFVYPMLEYFSSELLVRAAYTAIEEHHKQSMDCYARLRQEPPLTKSDARRVIPISSAQERHWWINARALRDFFRLRLAKDAEWEIRRLAGMVLDVVKGVTPVLFDDIGEKNE